MGRKSKPLSISSSSPADTRRFAACLAKRLPPGAVILLDGPIGSGKTTFVQGLADALGMGRLPVSASFSLMRTYKARGARLYHLDLFRLGGNDIPNLGLEDILGDEDAVTVVEWPGAARGFFGAALEIDFKLAGGDGRVITVSVDAGYAGILKELECAHAR